MSQTNGEPRPQAPSALDIPEPTSQSDDPDDLQTWDPPSDVFRWYWPLLRITYDRWIEAFRPFLLGALIATPISLLADVNQVDHLYSRLLWAEAMIASTLLGFALVATSTMLNVLKDDFLNAILEGSGLYGVQRTVWPFWFLALLAVVTIAIALVGIALSHSLCSEARRVFIGIVSFVLVSSVFSAVRLILYPWLYAVANAQQEDA